MRIIYFICFFSVIYVTLAEPSVNENNIKKRFMKMCTNFYDMSCPKRKNVLRRHTALRKETSVTTTTQRPLLMKFTVYTKTNLYQKKVHPFSVIPYSEYTLTIPVFNNYIEFSVRADYNAHLFLMSDFETIEAKVLLNSNYNTTQGYPLYDVILDMRSKYSAKAIKSQEAYNKYLGLNKIRKDLIRWFRIEWEINQDKSTRITLYALNLKEPVIEYNITRPFKVYAVGFGSQPTNAVTYMTKVQYPVTDQKYLPSKYIDASYRYIL